MKNQKTEIKEQVEHLGKLDEVNIIKTRKGKRKRIQYDYSSCISRTEQQDAMTNDIGQLMKKYSVDQLTQYIVAKNIHRQEITNHDFSAEPSLQEAKNVQLELKYAFENLRPEVRNLFRTPLDFLKFVENPKNEQKLIEMGLITKKELKNVSETIVKPGSPSPAVTESAPQGAAT